MMHSSKKGMEPYDRNFNDLIGAGGWENINAGHYALIEKALDQHTGKGKTFLITFGSWHKYYIKEQLAKRSDVNLVSMSQFLSGLIDPDLLLTNFSKHWDESRWEQEFRGMFYMRKTGNDDWQARMKVIHDLVANGRNSIPAIEKHLTSEHLPTRIVAAQSIGYLAQYANIERLQELFRNEPMQQSACILQMRLACRAKESKLTSMRWSKTKKIAM